VRVRHQHYQGEPHPASRKVTISAPIASLPLDTPAARHKFKLLAGPRWTPPLPGAAARQQQQQQQDEGEVKLACEMFPSERMNEKWCSDTLDKLVAEANVRPFFPLSLPRAKKRSADSTLSLLVPHRHLPSPSPTRTALHLDLAPRTRPSHLQSGDSFADVPLDPRPARARLVKSRKLKRNVSLRDFPAEWLPAERK